MNCLYSPLLLPLPAAHYIDYGIGRSDPYRSSPNLSQQSRAEYNYTLYCCRVNVEPKRILHVFKYFCGFAPDLFAGRDCYSDLATIAQLYCCLLSHSHRIGWAITVLETVKDLSRGNLNGICPPDLFDNWNTHPSKLSSFDGF